MPRSTVSRILRQGLGRLSSLEPRAGPALRASVRAKLLDLEYEKLARITERSRSRYRWRSLPPGEGLAGRNADAAVDDHNLLAFVEVFLDEGQHSVTEFLRHSVAWYAEQGLRIERVLTDRGFGRPISSLQRRPSRALQPSTSTCGPTRPRPTARSNASPSRPSPQAGATRSPTPARSGEDGPSLPGPRDDKLERPDHGRRGRDPLAATTRQKPEQRPET